MQLNEKIYDFNLLGIDSEGEEKEFFLSEFLGQNVVLYFYPKDDTPGCTKEACDFRDNFNRIASKAVVVGVSPDGIESHKKFQKMHSLNFILLSDPEKKVIERFGAWGEKLMYGKTDIGVIRSTFLIDKEGILRKEWRKVRVEGHVDNVISEIEKLN